MPLANARPHVIEYSYQTHRTEANMAQNDRFIRAYSKGFSAVNEIWIDRETGVNYLFHVSG